MKVSYALAAAGAMVVAAAFPGGVASAGVGAVQTNVSLFDARADSAAPPGAMLPALSFGLRSVSAPMPASHLVDRTLGSGSAVPAVSRVGIEYKPAQSQVFLNHGLGFRLGGDDKLTMRLRKGSLGIYLKRNF